MNINEQLQKILNKKILLLDGAMGTEILNKNLTYKDFGSKKFFGCNEQLNLSSPKIIKNIYREFLTAGANIILTNTFGANSLILGEYDLANKVFEINKKSGELAREVREEFKPSTKDIFIAGSIGPTNKMINLTCDISFDELKNIFSKQIEGLLAGGVDLIIFETFSDTSNLKAAIIALKEINPTTPFMISVTLEEDGKMLAGQNIETLYESVKHFNPISIGINCGGGAEQLKIELKKLSEIASCFVSFHPNAGLPDENGNYKENPISFKNKLASVVTDCQVNILGGCCGTTPLHIKELANLLNYPKIRQVVKPRKNTIITGSNLVIIDNENKPVLVGERTNTSGSLKFRKLIRSQKFDKAAEIAKGQIKNGGLIIDINLTDTESNEIENIENFYPLVVKKTPTPIMVDSSSGAKCIETALKFIQGKCIINSINLANKKRLDDIVKLSKKYGAALIVLLIDDKEMAVSLDRKIKIADKLYTLLTNKYNVNPSDIIFDTLVFPLGSGDNTYFQSGKNSMEAIKILKNKYPLVKFSLGVSNCSFGLPSKGREPLNTTYLKIATDYGLDLAIANSKKLPSFDSLSKIEKELCKTVVLNNTVDNIKKFCAYYQEKKETIPKKKDNILESLTERESCKIKISSLIIDGLKSGLSKELDKALNFYSAKKIIDEILIDAMNKVGEKFNSHEFTVIDVLESAESMKLAMDYLKKDITDVNNQSQGSLVLATVKGDVHDIGKNLVEMIFSSNGYNIIDLGTKVKAETIVDNIKKYNPLAIGLSGLLVQSAREMINCAEELQKEGINIPIIVGGAALSDNFVKNKIQPFYKGKVFYAKTAIAGLEIMNNIKSTNNNIKDKVSNDFNTDSKKNHTEISQTILPESITPSIGDLLPLLNWQFFYGKHLGLIGNYKKLITDGNKKALDLTKKVNSVLSKIIKDKRIQPKGIYRIFNALVKANKINIIDDKQNILEEFTFPPLSKTNKLSVADYVNNKIAFFCATSGNNFNSIAVEYKDKGDFVSAHIISALGISLAEAFAEYLHNKIKNSSILKGKRYSFGYSACPNLQDQVKLFNLLNVTKFTGISLTSNYMMNPENSVSAFIVEK